MFLKEPGGHHTNPTFFPFDVLDIVLTLYDIKQSKTKSKIKTAQTYKCVTVAQLPSFRSQSLEFNLISGSTLQLYF